jgi:hypothetical protein
VSINYKISRSQMVSKHSSVQKTFKDGEEEISKLVVVEKKHPEKVLSFKHFLNSFRVFFCHFLRFLN